jgi:hypothetical protein
VAALAAAGCGGEEPAGEWFAPKVTVPTEDPGRSFAIGRGPTGDTAIVLAHELRDAVHLYELTAGGTDDWGEVAVGVGPRSIAAVGFDFVTADATGGTLSRLHMDGGALVAVTGDPLATPPFFVGPIDGSTFAVVLGTGPAAAVQLWTLPAAPAGGPAPPPAPLGEPLPLADATVTVAAPGGLLLVVRRLAGDVVTLSATPAGELSIAATTPVCDDPRTAAPFGAGTSADIAVACRDGIVFLDGKRASLPYEGNLYDLVATDLDLDQVTDLAAIDLDEHAAAVWEGGAGVPRLYPLSRGPIALRAVDFDYDVDEDLIALAFEARAFDILENVVKGDDP